MASRNKLHNIKKKFPETLRECMGIISTACKKLNIERKTYYLWRDADPVFALACKEAEEHMGDFVEGKLISLINNENPTAIIFYCKTKLKNRGYVERIETTGKDGAPIENNVKLSDSEESIVERYLNSEAQKLANKLLESVSVQKPRKNKKVIN